MAKRKVKVDSAGEAFLEVLADRGVDYLFANAGTDFASIIEGLAKAAAGGAGQTSRHVDAGALPHGSPAPRGQPHP